jgi:putative membrane protein
MMHWYGGMRPGAWLLMGLFWVILLGGILFLVLRLLPSGRDTRTWQHKENPLDVLDQRFARGEVDLETYQAQRAALEATPARTPPRS